MGKHFLRIHLLGRPRVLQDGKPVEGFISKKALALFGYLAVQSGSQPRDRLAGLFWGEMPDARAKANLRMAIYNLQQLFPGYFQVSRLNIYFNRTKAYWLDVEQFERVLTSESPAEDGLQAALSLYRGELMEGIQLQDTPEVDEWLLAERERMRLLALEGLRRCAGLFMDTGRYDPAVQALQKLLRLAPWQESAHRLLMLALARRGEFSAALEQYETCRRVLAKELAVEPMPETRQLYKRIREAHDLPFRHNLPFQTTRLIGREEELKLLTRLLCDPTQRLVTITGPGGAGKTRLAVQVAAALVNTFFHGVYLVPLAALSGDAHLPAAVGRAMGVSFQGKDSPRAQLKRYLREKEALLVLDNCEHLPTLADFIAEILENAPLVKVLATSRKPLQLGQERVFGLEGLSYPGSDSIQDWEGYSALKLFVERARRRRGDFQPAAADWPAVLRICQLTGGLPLGIELAAACLEHYSCQALVAEIERGMNILAVSWPDLPARHRSMRAVFDHSWGLLSAQEQRVFRKAAVFRGSFSIEAALQVTEASQELLNSLVSRSLLHRIEPQEGQARFMLHELLRQYAGERLEEANEEQATRDRHLSYFPALAETARPGLDGADAQVCLERLEQELDNLRAALDWAVSSAANTAAGLRLAAALSEFWSRRGYQAEGQTWIKALQAKLESSTAGSGPPPAHLTAQFLISAGEIAYFTGNLAEAREYFETSLHLSQSAGTEAVTAQALMGLGATGWAQSDFDFARHCFEQSLAFYERIGNTHGCAAALRRLGQAVRIQGRYTQASTYYQQSLDCFRQTGDQRGIAQVLESLGVVARLQGDLERARELAEEGLEIRRSLNDPPGIGFSLLNLCAVAYECGDTDQAREFGKACLDLQEKLGNRVGAAAAINLLGDVALDQGDAQEARRFFEESLAQRRLLGEIYGMIDDLRGLSQVYQRMENGSKARGCLEEALALSKQMNLPRITAAVLRDLATEHLCSGDLAQSLAFARDSFDCAKQQADQRGIIESLEVLADICQKSGQPKTAAQLLACAAEQRSASGWKRPAREQAGASHRLQVLRAALEPEAFVQSWEAGRRLSIDQAVERFPSVLPAK